MDLLLVSPEPLGYPFRSTSAAGPPKSYPPMLLGMVIAVNSNAGSKSYQIRFRSKHWAKFVQYGVSDDKSKSSPKE
jgi:hypothetical protein